MKKLISLLILIALSCTNKGDSPRLSSDQAKRGTNSIQKFYGIWLSSTFYQSITQTQSPCGSSGSGGRVNDLTISDTCKLAWSYHEGITLIPDSLSEDTIYLRCLDNKDYSLKLRILSDSLLACYNCERDSTVLLRRAAIAQDTVDGTQYKGYPEYFRSKILSGAWTFTKTANDSSFRVSIGRSGVLQGFANFVSAEVMFDCMAPIDEIFFRTGEIDGMSYSFSFQSDTLLLHELIPENQSGGAAESPYDLKVGPIAFIGVRAK